MIYIGDRLTSVGFRLAGIRKSRVASEASIKTELSRLSEGEDIILIANKLFTGAPDEIDGLRRSGKIVVPIPDESGGGEDYINDLVRKAIGFEFRRQ